MITVRLPDDLRDRIDAVRGDVPRERWVRRALEGALDLQKVIHKDSAHLQKPRQPVPSITAPLKEEFTFEGTLLPKIAPRKQR